MTAPDPVAQIRAALDAAEQTAKAALHPDAVRPGEWMTEHHNSEYNDEPNRCHIAEDRSGHYWSVAHEVFIPVAEHMALWDPAAVLRHIAAARQILDSAVETLAEHEPPRCAWCLGRGTVCRDRDRALATLTALAAAWQPAQQETP